MHTITLSLIDWLIILLYFVFVIGIGYYLKKFMGTKEDIFEAGRRNRRHRYFYLRARNGLYG